MEPRQGNNPFGPNRDRWAEREQRAQRVYGDAGERLCGVWLGPARCGKPVLPRHSVCAGCERGIVSDMYRSGEGRRYMTGLLGLDAVTTEAHRQRLEAEQQKADEVEQRRKQREENRGAEVVYYIRTGEHQVKIGTTARLAERVRELRTVNLSNLLAVEPGGYDLERERHQQFKVWRYNPRTEDFWDAVELNDHIAAVVAEHGDPKAFLRREAESA